MRHDILPMEAGTSVQEEKLRECMRGDSEPERVGEWIHRNHAEMQEAQHRADGGSCRNTDWTGRSENLCWNQS